MGFTKGNSVQKIPPEVTKLCNEYLKQERGNGLSYNTSKKYIIIQEAFNKLNIPKEEVLMSIPKGVYFGYTFHQSKQFLTDTDTNHLESDNYQFQTTQLQTVSEWTSWRLNRWAIRRYTNLESNNLLKKSTEIIVS